MISWNIFGYHDTPVKKLKAFVTSSLTFNKLKRFITTIAQIQVVQELGSSAAGAPINNNIRMLPKCGRGQNAYF